MMIILYKKDKTKHKLLTCVSSTKSSSSVFMERMNKASGVEGAQTQRVQSCGRGLSAAPHPKLSELWLAAHSRGSKVRGKVSLCLPSLWCSNTCISHPYSHIKPHMHSLTCALPHTHTHWCQLEGGSDLSLCARPTRKYCSSAACLAMSRSCRGNTVCCRSWRPVCSS